MEEKIKELFKERSETAISELDSAYGALCRSLAFNIVGDRDDADECVDEAYLKLWNAIPPQDPDSLRAFLCKAVRRTAIDRLRHETAQKRGSGEYSVALDELSECIPSSSSPEREAESGELRSLLERFLDAQKPLARVIFIRRYFFAYSVKDVASQLGVSEGRVKMSLSRARLKLREYLKKEGFEP